MNSVTTRYIHMNKMQSTDQISSLQVHLHTKPEMNKPLAN